MVAHYLIDPDQRHNLEAMAESILQYTPIALSKLIGEKKSEQISVRDVPLDQLTSYAVEDADITLPMAYSQTVTHRKSIRKRLL